MSSYTNMKNASAIVILFSCLTAVCMAADTKPKKVVVPPLPPIPECSAKDTERWRLKNFDKEQTRAAYKRVREIANESIAGMKEIEPKIRKRKSELRKDPEIQRLEKEIAEKTKQLNEKLNSDPDVKKLNAEHKQHRTNAGRMREMRQQVINRIVQLGDAEFLKEQSRIEVSGSAVSAEAAPAKMSASK